MADLTRDDVLKLARLARIELAEEEIDEFKTELDEILRYVEQLQAVDTAGLQPTNQVTRLTNVTRPDEPIDYGYKPENMLTNVPERDGDFIKVKRMIN